MGKWFWYGELWRMNKSEEVINHWTKNIAHLHKEMDTQSWIQWAKQYKYICKSPGIYTNKKWSWGDPV